MKAFLVVMILLVGNNVRADLSEALKPAERIIVYLSGPNFTLPTVGWIVDAPGTMVGENAKAYAVHNNVVTIDRVARVANFLGHPMKTYKDLYAFIENLKSVASAGLRNPALRSTADYKALFQATQQVMPGLAPLFAEGKELAKQPGAVPVGVATAKVVMDVAGGGKVAVATSYSGAFSVAVPIVVVAGTGLALYKGVMVPISQRVIPNGLNNLVESDSDAFFGKVKAMETYEANLRRAQAEENTGKIFYRDPNYKLPADYRRNLLRTGIAQ